MRGAARWAPAVAWALLLLWLGRQAGDRLPAGGIWALPGIDKAAHAAAYGVLGALAAFAAGRRGVLAAVLAAALVGAMDEWGQAGVAGRSSDSLDLLADVAGAAIGALVLRRTLRRRVRSPDPGPTR